MAQPSSVLATVPSESKKKVSDIVTSGVTLHVQRQIDRCIPLNFLITAVDLDKLNGLFAPYIFSMLDTAKTPQNHAYAKVAEIIGRVFLEGVINRDGMEVGRDVKADRLFNHTCSLTTGRDDARAATNRFDPFYALHGDHRLCKAGGGECGERNNELYLNQVYISQESAAKLLIKKNARVLHLCMLMPPGVLLKASHSDPDRGITIEFAKGKAHMTFPDCGLGYSHNADDWRNWHVRSIVKVRNRYFLSEVINHCDWLKYYRMVEIFHPDSFVHQTTPMMEDLVAIPDIVGHYDEITLHAHALPWHRSSKVTKRLYNSMRKIMIPAQVLESIISYAHGRNDAAITRQAIAHMLRVEQFQVRVGFTILKQGFRVKSTDFTSLLVAISFMVMYQRCIATSTLGKLITTLKHGSLYNVFVNIWKRLVRTCWKDTSELAPPIGAAQFSGAAKTVVTLMSFVEGHSGTIVESKLDDTSIDLKHEQPVEESWLYSMPSGNCLAAAIAYHKDGTVNTASKYPAKPKELMSETLERYGVEDMPMEVYEGHCYMQQSIEHSCKHNVPRRFKGEDLKRTDVTLPCLSNNMPRPASTSDVVACEYFFAQVQKKSIIHIASKDLMPREQKVKRQLKPIFRGRMKRWTHAIVDTMEGTIYAPYGGTFSDNAVLKDNCKYLASSDQPELVSHPFPPNTRRVSGANPACDECYPHCNLVYANVATGEADVMTTRATQAKILKTLYSTVLPFTMYLEGGDMLAAPGIGNKEVISLLKEYDLYWYRTPTAGRGIWVNNIRIGKSFQPVTIETPISEESEASSGNTTDDTTTDNVDDSSDSSSASTDTPDSSSTDSSSDSDSDSTDSDSDEESESTEEPAVPRSEVNAPTEEQTDLADFKKKRDWRDFVKPPAKLKLATIMEIDEALAEALESPAELAVDNAITENTAEEPTITKEEATKEVEEPTIEQVEVPTPTQENRERIEEPISEKIEVPIQIEKVEETVIEQIGVPITPMVGKEEPHVAEEPTIEKAEVLVSHDVEKTTLDINNKGRPQRKKRKSKKKITCQSEEDMIQAIFNPKKEIVTPEKKTVAPATLETELEPTTTPTKPGKEVVVKVVKEKTHFPGRERKEPKVRVADRPKAKLPVTRRNDELVKVIILEEMVETALAYNPPGDGNCLFHCLAWVMETTHQEMRARIAPETTEGQWGEDKHVSRFAQLYQRSVVLLQPDQNAKPIMYACGEAPSVYIMLSHNHFTVHVLKINKQNRSTFEVVNTGYVAKVETGSVIIDKPHKRITFVGLNDQDTRETWAKMINLLRKTYEAVNMEVPDHLPKELRKMIDDEVPEWTGSNPWESKTYAPGMSNFGSAKPAKMLLDMPTGIYVEDKVYRESPTGCWIDYAEEPMTQKSGKKALKPKPLYPMQASGVQVKLDNLPIHVILQRVGTFTSNTQLTITGLTGLQLRYVALIINHTAYRKKISISMYTECELCASGLRQFSGVAGKNVRVPLPKIEKVDVIMSARQVAEMSNDFSKSLKTDKEKFREVHETAVKNLGEAKLTAKKITVEGICGAAGCGKTTIVRDSVPTKGAIVITPFSQLCKDYRAHGYAATTAASFIAKHHSHTFKCVVLDEVYAMHPMMLAYIYDCITTERIFVIGDKNQMSYGGKNKSKELEMKNFLKFNDYFNVTHGVPLDMTIMLHNSGLATGLVTNSAVIQSVTFHTATPQDVGFFTMSTTTAGSGYRNSITAAGAQGLRYPDVRFIIDQGGIPLLLSQRSMLLVALTRHTRHLQIVCSEEAREQLKLILPDLNNHKCRPNGPTERMEPIPIHPGNLPQEEEWFNSTEVAEEELEPFDAHEPEEMVEYENAGVNKGDQPIWRGKDQLKTFDQEALVQMQGSVITDRCTGPTFTSIQFQSHDSEAPMVVEKEEHGIKVSLPDHIGATLHAYNIPLHGGEFEKFDEKEYEVRRTYVPPNETVDCAIIERILSKISPSDAPCAPPLFGVVPVTLPEIEGTMEVKLGGDRRGNAFNVRDVEDTHLRLPIRPRGRPFSAKDPFQSTHAFASRCGTNPLKLSEEQSKEIAGSMLEQFDCLTENFTPITADDVTDGIACMLEAVAARKGQKHLTSFDLRQHRASKIKAFLKSQVKADKSSNSWLRIKEQADEVLSYDIKAGQTISAQSKPVNLLTGGIIRAIEKKIVQNLKPHIVFCQGLSPRMLKRKVKERARPNMMAFECDISQQDAMRGEWSNKHVMLEIYKKYAEGFIDPLILQEALNEYWVASNSFFNIGVRGHFQSGRSDTLFSNTLVNLLFVHSIIDIQDPCFVGVQGDDIAVLCISANPEIPRVFEPFVKYAEIPIPSLVGYLVHEGLHIDLPRMVIKLANRPYYCNSKDKSTWESLTEYQLAVRCWLSLVEDEKDIADMIAANAAYYDISWFESEVFWQFLYYFAYSKPEIILQMLVLEHTRPFII